MARHRIAAFTFLLFSAVWVEGQERSDTATLIAAQREAMAPLAILDGVWRGSASTILQSGQKHSITQTERIGPFLDGSVKVIEGRGYEPDGKVTFNAFGTISYNPSTRAYTLHSYAQGHAGDPKRSFGMYFDAFTRDAHTSCRFSTREFSGPITPIKQTCGTPLASLPLCSPTS